MGNSPDKTCLQNYEISRGVYHNLLEDVTCDAFLSNVENFSCNSNGYPCPKYVTIRRQEKDARTGEIQMVVRRVTPLTTRAEKDKPAFCSALDEGDQINEYPTEEGCPDSLNILNERIKTLKSKKFNKIGECKDDTYTTLSETNGFSCHKCGPCNTHVNVIIPKNNPSSLHIPMIPTAHQYGRCGAFYLSHKNICYIPDNELDIDIIEELKKLKAAERHLAENQKNQKNQSSIPSPEDNIVKSIFVGLIFMLLLGAAVYFTLFGFKTKKKSKRTEEENETRTKKKKKKIAFENIDQETFIPEKTIQIAQPMIDENERELRNIYFSQYPNTTV